LHLILHLQRLAQLIQCHKLVCNAKTFLYKNIILIKNKIKIVTLAKHKPIVPVPQQTSKTFVSLVGAARSMTH